MTLSREDYCRHCDRVRAALIDVLGPHVAKNGSRYYWDGLDQPERIVNFGQDAPSGSIGVGGRLDGGSATSWTVPAEAYARLPEAWRAAIDTYRASGSAYWWGWDYAGPGDLPNIIVDNVYGTCGEDAWWHLYTGDPEIGVPLTSATGHGWTLAQARANARALLLEALPAPSPGTSPGTRLGIYRNAQLQTRHAIQWDGTAWSLVGQ